jgi:hypothetical protein
MYQCRRGVFTLLGILFFSSQVFAQFANPLVLSEANPVEQVTVSVNEAAEVNFIRLLAYDPDFVDEGQMFINGQGPILLFPGGNGGFDGQERFIDIMLNNTQKGFLREGNNTFRFEWLSSQGFEIRDVTPVGNIAVEQYEAAPIDTAGASDEFRYKALQLYQRLVGVKTSIDNPKLVEMANYIQAGQELQAAQVATTEPGFYNNVVRDFGARMSTIDEVSTAPMSDLVATVIGITRDDIDAREMLTGRFFYMANRDAPVPSNIMEDIVKSNRHYSTLEDDGYDFMASLARMDSQFLRGPNDQLFEATDTAGVITSRAFMEAHATAGTNRRMVEYTMQVFACAPLTTWADARSSDINVGRDVDRFPGGDPNVFRTQCKSCHGNMDGFRGAFAQFDFANGFTKYATLYPNGDEDDPNALPQNPIGVAAKYNRNDEVFPGGHVTADTTWVNFARSPANQELFGWRAGAEQGNGVASLGAAVANSTAFSKCMVKRVFRELCNRPVSAFEIPLVDGMSSSFEQTGYNLKSLFEQISIRPECAGQ